MKKFALFFAFLLTFSQISLAQFPQGFLKKFACYGKNRLQLYQFKNGSLVWRLIEKCKETCFKGFCIPVIHKNHYAPTYFRINESKMKLESFELVQKEERIPIFLFIIIILAALTFAQKFLVKRFLKKEEEFLIT